MRKIMLVLPFVLLFVFGCQKLAQLLTFEISDTENIQIPASGLVSAPVISPVPVTMNNQQSFKNNNTAASLVKDVTLTKLTLTITDPSTQNFDFLQSIKIYIGTSQSDTVLLASQNNIPTGVSSIDLTPANSKLDKYIKDSSYTLYTQVGLRSTVAQQTTIRADSRFRVTADPL